LHSGLTPPHYTACAHTPLLHWFGVALRFRSVPQVHRTRSRAFSPPLHRTRTLHLPAGAPLPPPVCAVAALPPHCVLDLLDCRGLRVRVSGSPFYALRSLFVPFSFLISFTRFALRFLHTGCTAVPHATYSSTGSPPSTHPGSLLPHGSLRGWLDAFVLPARHCISCAPPRGCRTARLRGSSPHALLHSVAALRSFCTVRSLPHRTYTTAARMVLLVLDCGSVRTTAYRCCSAPQTLAPGSACLPPHFVQQAHHFGWFGCPLPLPFPSTPFIRMRCQPYGSNSPRHLLRALCARTRARATLRMPAGSPAVASTVNNGMARCAFTLRLLVGCAFGSTACCARLFVWFCRALYTSSLRHKTTP